MKKSQEELLALLREGITPATGCTDYAVAEKQKLPKEKLIRSLALTNLITFFIKSYTGTLSAMCGCEVVA
ncbi:MAG: L-serine ammonia-lyase, iron-sulfur-dependent, subunit alpha [Candidatus Marinimicrobia bacterium]|nr:L-serine ammonia-lyase, iron-sulfur-dependent, subunit alpha [Candidatus Neomarinimicrobiota bacterium]